MKGGRLQPTVSTSNQPQLMADDPEAARRSTALAAIVAYGAHCTCTPDSDIRDCPNYQPGDEQGWDDDDADDL